VVVAFADEVVEEVEVREAAVVGEEVEEEVVGEMGELKTRR
jgi:hypothetical protein